MVQFVAKVGLRYKIIYFGNGTGDDNNEKCWDLLHDCGNNALLYMENFVFISLPKWTRFKMCVCCRGTLPVYLTDNIAIFMRYDRIRDFLQDYYNTRDPYMCFRIYEQLPRASMEFYYNEAAQNQWSMPSEDEVKVRATRMAA